jgi:hypothetical protein
MCTHDSNKKKKFICIRKNAEFYADFADFEPVSKIRKIHPEEVIWRKLLPNSHRRERIQHKIRLCFANNSKLVE